MDFDVKNIHSLLDASTEAVGNFTKNLQTSDLTGDLDEFVTILVTMGNGLKSVKTYANAKSIQASKLQALKNAIEELLMDPTTEQKILVIQAQIFGGHTPLMKMLREMQQMLRVVESLKKGKKVESIEGMDPIG